MAVREDEVAADCMGVDPIKTKLLAFALGASFSGLAGAVYAAKLQAIFPELFRFQVSIMLLCIVILGGMGNLKGVILGDMLSCSSIALSWRNPPNWCGAWGRLLVAMRSCVLTCPYGAGSFWGHAHCGDGTPSRRTLAQCTACRRAPCRRRGGLNMALLEAHRIVKRFGG